MVQNNQEQPASDTLTVEIAPGEQIGYAIRRLIDASVTLDVPLRAQFNSCWLSVNPTSTFDEVAKQYDDHNAQGAAEREAKRREDARMLAAVPDLLEAARMLAELEKFENGRSGGRTFPTIEQCAFARAAILKATANAE